MKVGRKEWFHDVLDIPEAEIGRWAVKHHIIPAGKPVPTSNARTAIFRGQSRPQVVYNRDTRWHKLLEDGGTWMSDLPIEQIQHDEELQGFTGRVLVGGLGLGYAITSLALRKQVKEIVCVEIQPEVVQLVWPSLVQRLSRPKLKLTLVQDDLFTYLEQYSGPRFDYGFFDIWTADGEYVFHHTVMPLRRLSKGKVKYLTCWNEAVMRGQLRQGLDVRILMTLKRDAIASSGCDPNFFPTLDQLADGFPEDREASIYTNWARPFWQWVRATNPTPEEADRVASTYTAYYGRVPDDAMFIMTGIPAGGK